MIALTHAFGVCLLNYTGYRPEDGVPDMTIISNIDEQGINTNLKTRYKREQIYVSLFMNLFGMIF